MTESRDYSFACGGWLKMYLFGVSKCLQEIKAIDKTSRLIGSSAGSLAATGLALDADFDGIKNHVLNKILPQAHGRFTGLFKVREYLHDTLDNFGQLDRFEEINVSQQVVVSYTALLSCKTRRISTFRDEAHLKQTLLASCCASPIAGLPFKHDNEWIFDGGLTDFQPIFDDSTITVSPFYCTSADIRPSRYVPLWWALIPPSRENIEWLYELGYEDAHAWAYRQGLVAKPLTESESKAAKYDGAWSSKFGRFVGYKAVENGILDACFAFLVVFLWKPLAFLLVYFELCTKVLISGSQAAMFGAACKLMITLCIAGALASMTPVVFSSSSFLLPTVIIGSISLLFIILTLCIGGIKCATEKATKDWQTCTICLRNIVSLSLLLRTVPFLGVYVPIKRHEFLMEHSMIYRLTNHFV